jgi:tape measure domain-containing protein
VAAYRADIEIGVRGIQQLQNTTKQIDLLSKGVDGINKRFAGGIQSLNAYDANLAKAARTLSRVNAGTIAETDAVKLYVTALGQANAARDRQNRLIQEQIALQRKAVATADAGFGVQGPALPPTGRGGRGGRGRLASRLGGAVSGAAIGGAFPLLFGQSAGAAAGGAIGGLAGGLLGPGGSFAGSLVGTILGDIAAKGNVVKQLGQDIGFSAEQTRTLETAFKQAGREFDKFQASVQNIRGLGLEIDAQAEAIKLVSTLTEKYGGTIDKVTNAFTSALESGKVSQATLNQLTSQGIPIQEALADKYNVSRSALLQMAKDGKISVQDLTDTLVEVGNQGVTAATKTSNGFTQLSTATKDLGSAFQQLAGAIVTALSPALEWLAGKIAGIISLAAQGVQAVARMISGGSQTDVAASAMAGAQLVKEFPELRSQRMGGRAGKALVQNNTLAVGATGQLTPEQLNRYNQLRSKAMGTLQTPAPIKRIDVSGLGQLPPSADKNSGVDKAARDAARLEEQRKKQLETAARLAVEMDTRVKMAAAITKEEELQAGLDQARMERMTKYETLYQKALSDAEREFLVSAQLAEITAEKLDYEEKINDIRLEQATALSSGDTLGQAQAEINLLAAKLQGKEREYTLQLAIDDLVRQGVTLEDAQNTVKAVDALNQKYQEQLNLQQMLGTIGQATGDVLLSVFDNLISKTQSWNDVLRNSLAGIGRILMMAGLNAWAGAGDPAGKSVGILSFLGFGKRAAGGPVTSGAPYLVGERGPELFVPGTGGSVVPTNNLRSAMASGNSPVLSMSFETTSINGVEYVSREQLEAAMAVTRRQASRDGAQRGMSMTLDRLQQSPSTRRRVGI